MMILNWSFFFIGQTYLNNSAGQEDYDRLRPLSYDNVDVILICYDVSCKDSFENVQVRWAPEIRHFCYKIPVILVGCKIDLRNGEKSLQFLSPENLKTDIVTTEMVT